MRFDPPEIVKNFKFSYFPDIKSLSILFFLFVTLNAIRIVNDTNGNQTIIIFFILYLSAFFLIFALILISKLLRKLHGDRIPVLKIYISGTLLGVSKGAITYIFLNIYVYKDSYPWDELALEAFSRGTLGLFLAFLFSLRASYKSEIRDVINSYRKDNNTLKQQASLLFDEIAMIKSGTQKQIIERLLRDRTLWKEIDLYSKKPEDNFARISEALRGNISNKLRAQSRGLHRLGMGVPESKVAFIKSLRLENLNIHPKVLALLQFSIGVSISYEDSSGANSFLGAAINAFLTYVAARFFKEMLRNDTEISRQTNCSALLLMVITIVTFFIFSEHLLQVEGFESPSSLMIAATIIWVTLLILLVSGVSESLKIMNSIAKMEAEINIDLLDKVRILSEHEAQARHDLGKFIHGFLINKVQATATHLDALAVQGKFDDYEENLLKLFDEFSVDSINTKLNSRILDLDFIEKLKALWAEMIVIEVEADEAIFTKFQKPQALELGRVIEEMVSNAFRHGNATQINILFSAKDEIQLQIMARDNGLGIAGKPRPGLGSQIFEMSSGGNWTLGNFDTGGAQVVVNVELYSPESKLVW